MIANGLKETVTKNTKTLVFGTIFPPLGVLFGLYILAKGFYKKNRSVTVRGGIIVLIMSLVTVFQFSALSLKSPIMRFTTLTGLMFGLFISIVFVLRLTGVYEETVDELKVNSVDNNSSPDLNPEVCDECGTENSDFSTFCRNCTKRL